MQIEGIWVSLVPFLVAALFVGLFWLIVAGTAVLRAQAQKIQSEQFRAALTTAITEGGALLGRIVRQLQVQVVDQLKAQSADGKLTEDEIRLLQRTVKERFQAELSREIYEVLEKAIPDLDAWIQTQVDHHLYDLKLERSMVETVRKVEAVANPL